MLTYAADFWLWFWLIIAGGAVLTVLASLLVATFSPTWFTGHRHPVPVLHHHREAPSGHLPKAA